MQTANTIAELHSILQPWQQQNLGVAYVPTMGNLHAGHLQLVQRALQAADRVIVSIFVNPLQFGPQEDFLQYPRTLEQDSLKLAELGVHGLFAPTAEEIFPQGLAKQTRVLVPELAADLCGKNRPEHFVGVTTVVAKFFNLIKPKLAFFGEKDFQQLVMLKKMVADLAMGTEIIAVPTVREGNGLALSSRNQYLSAEERVIAPKLNEILEAMHLSILNGENNLDKLIKDGLAKLREAGFKPEYLAIRSLPDLQPVTAKHSSLIILAAAYLGKTRLIDNVQVNPTLPQAL